MYILSLYVVDIQADHNLFDYCSLDSYEETKIQPLLKLHGLEKEEKWAMAFDR